MVFGECEEIRVGKYNKGTDDRDAAVESEGR